jgi:threonine dehydratase
MTTTEALHTPEAGELNAETVYEQVLTGMHDIDMRGLQAEMGVIATTLTEIPVNGRHRLLILDETVQPGNNFKYNGASYAVKRLVETQPDVREIVTGTAGNFGSAVAAAAQKLGLACHIKAPADLSDAKNIQMERYGAKLDTSYPDVLAAIAAAEQEAVVDPRVAFLHPFNDLNAIAGQAMVGQRIVNGLLQRQQESKLDLQADPVEILVQRGGGSLLTGVACAVKQLKDARVASENLQVCEVRPEFETDGQLNLKYDGLAVEAPGSYARIILDDPEFVQDKVEVSEVDTGHAALKMHWRLHKSYEPSGLAGVAACLKAMATAKAPTTYVAVLSGANVTPERFRYFANEVTAADQARRLGQLTLTQPNLDSNLQTLNRSTSVMSGHIFPRAALLPDARRLQQ